MSANEFYTNHMTTFLCHVTTSFGHHVISFLQPTVQNSNGGFTTLVILIVTAKPFYSSHTTNSQIRVTVLDYHEKAFVAIIFLHKKTADEDLFKDIFHGKASSVVSWPRLFKGWITLSAGKIAIQYISVDKTTHAIRWIGIYPLDSVIHISNNQGQAFCYWQEVPSFFLFR